MGWAAPVRGEEQGACRQTQGPAPRGMPALARKACIIFLLNFIMGMRHQNPRKTSESPATQAA